MLCMELSADLNEAISIVVHTYSTSVLRFAYSYVKNRSDAEDIAQDVFITYIQKTPDFDHEMQRKAWIMSVTSNKCKDYLKSSWKKRVTSMPENLGYLPKEESTLISYVCELDEKYRIPIHLYYFEGYSVEEIASITGNKSATVATWLSRGRALLKTMIGDDFCE